jgi:hypothetical protein
MDWTTRTSRIYGFTRPQRRHRMDRATRGSRIHRATRPERRYRMDRTARSEWSEWDRTHRRYRTPWSSNIPSELNDLWVMGVVRNTPHTTKWKHMYDINSLAKHVQ